MNSVKLFALWIVICFSCFSQQTVNAAENVDIELQESGINFSALPDVLDPRVAVNADGNALAVWVEAEGSNQVIKASQRLLNGSWSKSVTLSSPDKNTCNPVVAFDLEGNARAAWIVVENGYHYAQCCTLYLDGEWSVPIDSEIEETMGSLPEISVHPEGYVMDAWNYQAPSISSISPAKGSVYGGNSVTISGRNFDNVQSIKFGSRNASYFYSYSPYSISVTVPYAYLYQAGPVAVLVVTANGKATCTYTYE
jgi:hypothetical protein